MWLSISIILFCYMTLLFGVAQTKHNNGIADIGWGVGFILVAVSAYLFAAYESMRGYIMIILILIWAARISYYLCKRNWGKQEDSRYAALRSKWGSNEKLYAYFIIYFFQGFLLCVIAYPVMLVHAMSPVVLTIRDWYAVALWCLGFFWEAMGDYQLASFLKDPANRDRIMKYGLWKYTRHPNYFGECLMWVALFLLALPVTYGWTAIISPIIITFMLCFVSGIPMAEKLFENNNEYQEYKKKTSALIPWFTKGN